jgi:hypothetical protein
MGKGGGGGGGVEAKRSKDFMYNIRKEKIAPFCFHVFLLGIFLSRFGPIRFRTRIDWRRLTTAAVCCCCSCPACLTFLNPAPGPKALPSQACTDYTDGPPTKRRRRRKAVTREMRSFVFMSTAFLSAVLMICPSSPT